MPPSAAGVSIQNHMTTCENDASRLPHDREVAKLFMLQSLRIQNGFVRTRVRMGSRLLRV